MVDDHSQRHLALPMPGSNCMNAKKVPGAYPYCNHYRNFVDLVKPQKFNTTKQFLCKLFLT